MENGSPLGEPITKCICSLPISPLPNGLSPLTADRFDPSCFGRTACRYCLAEPTTSSRWRMSPLVPRFAHSAAIRLLFQVLPFLPMEKHWPAEAMTRRSSSGTSKQGRLARPSRKRRRRSSGSPHPRCEHHCCGLGRQPASRLSKRRLPNFHPIPRTSCRCLFDRLRAFGCRGGRQQPPFRFRTRASIDRPARRPPPSSRSDQGREDCDYCER